MTPYYQDDSVTLYCGDALEILPELSDIGALITDPPYSSGGFTRSDRSARTSEKYQNSSTIKKYAEFFGDNRDGRSFAFWCSLWLTMAHSRMVDGAFMAIFSDWRQLPLMSDALQAGGFVWRGTAVWDKGLSARPQLGRPRQQCEFILWGSKGQFPTAGSTFPGCWKIPVESYDKLHVTGKPPVLMAALCEIAAGVILDPFAGSGTTLLAAKQQGRRAVGIEMSEAYCEITAKRLQQPELLGSVTA